MRWGIEGACRTAAHTLGSPVSFLKKEGGKYLDAFLPGVGGV